MKLSWNFTNSRRAWRTLGSVNIVRQPMNVHSSSQDAPCRVQYAITSVKRSLSRNNTKLAFLGGAKRCHPSDSDWSNGKDASRGQRTALVSKPTKASVLLLSPALLLLMLLLLLSLSPSLLLFSLLFSLLSLLLFLVVIAAASIYSHVVLKLSIAKATTGSHESWRPPPLRIGFFR